MFGESDMIPVSEIHVCLFHTAIQMTCWDPILHLQSALNVTIKQLRATFENLAPGFK